MLKFFKRVLHTEGHKRAQKAQKGTKGQKNPKGLKSVNRDEPDEMSPADQCDVKKY